MSNTQEIQNDNLAKFVALQRAMAKQIKWDQLARLHAAWENDPTRANALKYTSGDNLIRMSAMVYELGLHERAPLRIADIGVGFGWFALALKTIGHEVICLDRGGCKKMEEGRACLGINAIEWNIRPNIPLPREFRDFDFISMMSVNLRNRNDALFRPIDYRFFLADLRSRLRPGGRIFILVNPRIEPTYQILTPAFWQEAVQETGLRETVVGKAVFFEMV